MNDSSKIVNQGAVANEFSSDLLDLLTKAQLDYDQDRLESAIASINSILEVQHSHPEANFLLARILFHVDAKEEALKCLEKSLSAQPGNASFWALYIEVIATFANPALLNQAQQLMNASLSATNTMLQTPVESASMQQLRALKQRANGSSKKTSKLDAKHVQQINQLSNLYAQQQLDEVEKLALHLISQHAQNAYAWRFLGIAYLDANILPEAELAMQTSIQLAPKDALSHFNYALFCSRTQALELAQQHYRLALKYDPNLVAAYNNLGNCLRALGQFDEAEAVLRKLLQLQPNIPMARVNLIGVLKDNLKKEAALIEAKLAFEKAPEVPEVLNCYGSILSLEHRYQEALPLLQKALELRPDFVDAHNNLGGALFGLHQYAPAKHHFLSALNLNPQLANAYRCLGQISQLLDNDQIASRDYFLKALQCDAQDATAITSYLFLINEMQDLSPEQIYQEHRHFARLREDRYRHEWNSHTNSKQAQRCLRIGFVSGDLNNHAVASFIDPILSRLAQAEDLQLLAYYTNDKQEDAMSARLRTYFTTWNAVSNLTDDALYRLIQRDQVDILFDLSGHTSYNRLPVFARRPAPLAITWIGYPGTTGMEAVDYYFTDGYFLPKGQFEHLFTEKMIRLPASAPFAPFAKAPMVEPLPALKNGNITFASFNRPTKLTDAVIQLWVDILNAVPSSKLFLASMPSDSSADLIINKFIRSGLPRERLICFGRCAMEVYMEQLNKVDICLDSFPYNGGTTTLHSASMGVPTITMAGTIVASRTGACIMSHLGLQRMIVHTPQEYVNEAVYWSEHLSELAQIRTELRTRLQQSAMCQPNLIADALHIALRTMWQRWCQGLPAESFEVLDVHEALDKLAMSIPHLEQ